MNITNSSRALDVQITRLRNKIEKNKKFPTYIQTVRGRGYVLKIE
ncbi:MAG: helix-turn-helix domain-containing protein [Alphaproteobacteria bacterium]|nr:helix-turn-helix domain-containing protein [Alphaproteobacteria bacterium]